MELEKEKPLRLLTSCRRKQYVLSACSVVVFFMAVFLSGCGDDDEGSLGGTKTVNLCFINTLPYDVLVEASECANSDWNSATLRPDVNFAKQVVKAGEYVLHQEKMNMFNKTHPATFKLTAYDDISTGDSIAVDKWRMPDLNDISPDGMFRVAAMYEEGFSRKIQVVAGEYGDRSVWVILTNAGLDMSNWMAELEDDVYLSEITAPGTHDTGTWAYPGCGAVTLWVKCQYKSLEEQLSLGARFLDVRLGPKAHYEYDQQGQPVLVSCDQELYFYHSAFFIDVTFRQALDEIQRFLDSHPGETIVMRAMSDFECDLPDFPRTRGLFYDVVTSEQYRGLFVSPPPSEIPTLGSIRGKVLLLCDPNMVTDPPTSVPFKYTSDTSLEYIPWPGSQKNSSFAISDNWNATNTDMKKDRVGKFFEEMRNQQDPTIFPVLFLSASHAVNCSPRCFADEVNRYAALYPENHSFGRGLRLGFVVMDFLGTNAQLCGAHDCNGLPYLLVARNFPGYFE